MVLGCYRRVERWAAWRGGRAFAFRCQARVLAALVSVWERSGDARQVGWVRIRSGVGLRCVERDPATPKRPPITPGGPGGCRAHEGVGHEDDHEKHVRDAQRRPDETPHDLQVDAGPTARAMDPRTAQMNRMVKYVDRGLPAWIAAMKEGPERAEAHWRVRQRFDCFRVAAPRPRPVPHENELSGAEGGSSRAVARAIGQGLVLSLAAHGRGSRSASSRRLSAVTDYRHRPR